jgi:hypothetical protein
MEDTEFTPGVMNGQKFESGRFAGSLRQNLMREHLGLDAGEKHLVGDPVTEKFWLEFIVLSLPVGP